MNKRLQGVVIDPAHASYLFPNVKMYKQEAIKYLKDHLFIVI